MVRLEVSKSSPLPLHTQLLDDLRHKVLTGVFKPHEQLPGEWEIASELNISRTTIQKAWQNAEEERLIYRIPGRGTFIAEVSTPGRMRPSVGLILPDFRSTFAAQLLQGSERILRQKGYRLVVASNEYSVAEENRGLQRMYEDGLRGIIIWAVQSSETDRRLMSLSNSMPMVLLDRFVQGVHLPCVSSNNYAGGLQAMEHLIALGHRKIAFLARPHLQLWAVRERYHAYADALKNIGEIPAEPILIGTEQELSSYNAYLPSDDPTLEPLIRYLQQADRPTAIFAVNDWMAIRALRSANAVGLRVPDDLSVIGFDNHEVTSSLTPPLTTIAQNPGLIGAEAARRLISRIEGEPLQEVFSLLPTQLIMRGSTAPPKKPGKQGIPLESISALPNEGTEEQG